MAKRKRYKIRSIGIESTVMEGLSDPKIAVAYIRDCLNERGESRGRLLLRALMNVARAHGVSHLARGSESKRRQIYKTFSEEANPSLSTLETLLNDMGLTVDIKPLKKTG